MAKAERLTGAQREELAKALLSGFPTRERFDALLDFGLDIRPDDYPGGLPKAIRTLLTDLVADEKIPTLVSKAVARTPNADLRAFHDKYFSLVWPPKGNAEFEAMVTPLGFESLEGWLARATAIKSQVCRVELGEARGTGFLVGRDLVLTNYHVVESVIEQAKPDIVLRFDVGAEGNAGAAYKLATSWRAGYSPYSPVDLEENPAREPTPDELDFALLRIDAPVGDTRGWQTPAKGGACKEGAPIIIVQHPAGEHLQIALDTNAILRVGPTRMRYRTNTKHGSSGSPCFDLAWNLVALHHSGDQSFKAIWNEGIPIEPIAKHVEAAIAGS